MKRKFLPVSLLTLLCVFSLADYTSAQIMRGVRGTQQARQNTVPQSSSSTINQTRTIVPRSSTSTANSSTNEPGKNYAVLIGINTYLPVAEGTDEFEPLPLRNLKYCITDMTGLKTALVTSKYTEDENIVLLVTSEETTLDYILGTLEDFRKILKPNDNILIALSGHGVSLAPKNNPDAKEDYFCCSDARVVYRIKDDKYDHEGLLSLSKVNDVLESYSCKSKIVFTDACRNILGEEGSADKSTANSVVDAANPVLSRSMVGGLVTIAERQKEIEGFFRMASCKKEEVSHELESLQHGVFTFYLIQGLSGNADKEDEGRGGNGDGNITLNELFNYARFRTSDYVTNHLTNKTQTPTFSSAEATGDFVIGHCEPAKKPAVQQPTPPSNPPTRPPQSSSPPRSSSPPIVKPN